MVVVVPAEFVFWDLAARVVLARVIPPRDRNAANAKVTVNLFLIISSAAMQRSTVR
jgi:hypothetical protein